VSALAVAIENQVMTPWSADELMRRFRDADIFAGVGVAVIHPMDGRLVAQGKSDGISAMGALRLQNSQETLEVQIGELSLREYETIS
jgi:biotin-(acetyl-CoA carboxylase) ligase